MSHSEFVEWQAYHRLDPFGNERGDYQSGIIAATQVNLWSKQKRKPSDFMPRFGEKDEPQTPAEMKALLGIPSGDNNS